MRAALPALLFLSVAACAGRPARDPALSLQVGRLPDGRFVLPQNQTLQPYGRLVELPGLRPQAIALSRDGRFLYVSGKTSELLVLDAATCEVRQRVAMPNDAQTAAPTDAGGMVLKPDENALQSFTGLVVGADGRTIWQSNVKGSIKVYAVAADGAVTASHSLPLPPANAPRRAAEIPSGLALSADGRKLYVCGNLSNNLLELDATTGRVLRTFPVGVAPFDVVLAGNRAFVSNWGGRRPQLGDTVGPAGQGTTVRVDPVRHIASEGSVSVIDLASGAAVGETRTGLHASGLALSPDRRHVVCANAASDTVSVLDAGSGALLATLWCKQKPSELLCASPNALCFDADGRRLYVANGTQNAIAVFRFEPDDRGDSRLLGMIPVGWYPGALLFDAGHRRVIAANLKGLPPGTPREHAAPEFNSLVHHGSLSFVDVPDDGLLPALAAQVDLARRLPAIAESQLPPRPGTLPRAIPERIGEPSLIQHVVYVIKENRTYDQVLGDVASGNGDPSLCVFGERFTPNQHALAQQFVLLDNTYCAGILSADGHNWSMAAFANDYVEKGFAGWPRSYPDGMGEDESDALAWSPAGFLWDRAIARGISLRNFGEFCEPRVHWRDPLQKGAPGLAACWRTWHGKDRAVVFGCAPVIPSLRPCSSADYVGWDLSVPDQYRADVFLRELADATRRDTFPQLTIVCLPNDHTNGTSPQTLTPGAYVADNDLALGRILEGLGRSPFWPRMAVFVIEDDPQAGWDHVSGYRTTCYLAGPHVRRGAVISTQYNTTSVLRTIEQILGIQPMNQFDASPRPMSDCFTDEPDLAPFVAHQSRVPLEQYNPKPTSIADPQLRADALASAAMDFAHADRAPEDQLNRILWRAMRGTAVPYPEWAVTAAGDDDDH
jgi:DNA-binding beta-propeller fold protein YncE